VSEEERNIAARDLRDSAVDFISALRLGEGMNEELFARLASATTDVGSAWAESEVLPKGVVNDLVGLFSWIDSASYLYEGDEAARIKRAAMEIEILIFERVVPAPPES
jgi:hypothetical protein